jgi:hypothetical protein
MGLSTLHYLDSKFVYLVHLSLKLEEVIHTSSQSHFGLTYPEGTEGLILKNEK